MVENTGAAKVVPGGGNGLPLPLHDVAESVKLSAIRTKTALFSIV
jgi:hypothetical protein